MLVLTRAQLSGISPGTIHSHSGQKDEKVSAELMVRDIRRQTRRKYSAEETIRIVLEGLRGEKSIAELCRREGINPNMTCESRKRR